MVTIFNTPISSPVIIVLTIVYFVVASITTFDTRLIQGKENGFLPSDEPMLPSWIGVFGWLQWIVWIALLILNWKYALIVFVVKFILKVLPILEVVGNILMSPWRKK